MRKIDVRTIKDAISKLSIDANVNLRADVRRAMEKALKKEKKNTARETLRVFLENADIAKRERRALCQDTGLVSVYMEIGQGVRLTGGDVKEAIEEGVREGYEKGFLRKSVVKSPILRENTGQNTPPVIYTELVKGDKVKITVVPKGFGSENKSKIAMLKPTDGEEKIISFVLDTVKSAGPDACPPYILGIGLGGTFDKAAHLAKKALIFPVDRPNPKRHLRKLEESILRKVNALGIGPMGLGGKTTCLGVNILEYPTHIAGLPVAVNLGCHITRSAGKII